MKEWFVYLLISVDIPGLTYVGATVDVAKRLRQHNGEIKGGAKYTKGRKWRRVCFMSNFPDQRAALQFEWKWKQLTKTMRCGKTAFDKRVLALQKLIRSGKSTKSSVPFNALMLHVEDFNICLMKSFTGICECKFSFPTNFTSIFILALLFVYCNQPFFFERKHK